MDGRAPLPVPVSPLRSSSPSLFLPLGLGFGDGILRACIADLWERRPFPPSALRAFESIQFAVSVVFLLEFLFSLCLFLAQDCSWATAALTYLPQGAGCRRWLWCLRSTRSAAAWTLVHSHQRWHSKAAWGTARRLVLGQQARRVWETQASIFFLALCTGGLILQGEGQ